MADLFAASGVLVVGGDVSDAGVEADAVVVAACASQFGRRRRLGRLRGFRRLVAGLDYRSGYGIDLAHSRSQCPADVPQRTRYQPWMGEMIVGVALEILSRTVGPHNIMTTDDLGAAERRS